MNFLVGFSYILVLSRLTDAGDIRYSAITDMEAWYLSRLYLEAWTPDPPSAMDPANADPSVRQRICDEISKSGVFWGYRRQAVDMNGIRDKITSDPTYSDISERIYRPVADQTSFEYINAYTKQDVQITKYFPSDANKKPVEGKKKEHAFMCLLRETEKPEIIVPFYVSKEYNVLGGPHVHRFVFAQGERDWSVYLAENGADVYEKPNFNVELHYLELKKRHESVQGYDSNFLSSNSVCRRDPVCKLNAGNVQDNQLFRLCAAIFSSAYFKNKNTEYPRRVAYNRYYRRNVTFRTPEGKRKSGGTVYDEIMLECWTDKSDGKGITIYNVSRAYAPGQVFVYLEDPQHKGSYNLENLVTNVHIVLEDIEFTDVEI